MAPTEALSRDAILEATETVLRRHGPAKATVLDVARVLGVSHGSVYRHFPSKAALRAAVTRRWLHRALADLALIAEDGTPPDDRLRAWLLALFDAKRAKVLDDPELFATYSVLTGERAELVDEHIADMVAQIAGIVADGVASGAFVPTDVPRTARAVFDATTLFHSPVLASTWRADDVDGRFEAVVALVLDGLRAPAAAAS